MSKLASVCPALATGLVLLGAATAQRAPVARTPLAPAPVARAPVGMPTANRPTAAGQVVEDRTSSGGMTCAPVTSRPKRDPATVGVKIEGRDLKRAVARVDALRWHKSLAKAEAEARQTGKPVLWLQTLGSLSGFA